MWILLLLLWVALGAPAAVAAPDTDADPASTATGTVYTIELLDGSTVQGVVFDETETHVHLRTPGGLEVRVPRSQIDSMAPRRGRVVEDRFRRIDPGYSRLLYAPTGYPLRAGDGYLANHYVFFPSVAVGVTDHLSILGGMSLFPGISLGQQLRYLAPRIGTTFEGGAVSVGTLWFGIDDESAGVAFAMASIGAPENSFSVGIGIPYSGTDVADATIIGLGANLRLSSSAAFIMENWLVVEDEESGFILGPGIRFYGDRLSGDFALLIPEGGDAVVPWLSVTYSFGGATHR